MQIRRKPMNNRSGKVMYRKVTALPCPENIKGNNAVIKMIITITALKAIIRYLNFNEKAPIMHIIIKERLCYVNNAGFVICSGGKNERF